MPKTSIDYNNTLIYKLCHKEDYDNANIYIGSTTNFTQRKNQHKFACINENAKEHNQKKYQYIRNNEGWNEWNMIEIEKYPCADKNESKAREEYWRTRFNANLNSIRCNQGLSHKEQCKIYRTDNIEHIKTYNQKNADRRKAYQKQYQETKKTEKLT